MIINRKNHKNSLPNDYWKEVDQKAHYLVADILNQKLPLPNLRDKKNLDLNEDADWRSLLVDYNINYAENLPDSDLVAHEITYEYLLLVVKSLVGSLKEFTCHQEEYLEGII